jgi:hypothetical protein
MLVLGNPRVADRTDQAELFKGMDGLANLFFREIQHRVPTRTLVARINQSIERERIVLRRSDLFFDERAQNAELMGRKMHRYKVATDEGPVGVADNRRNDSQTNK